MLTGFDRAQAAYDSGSDGGPYSLTECETPTQVDCACCEGTGAHADGDGPLANEYDCQACTGHGQFDIVQKGQS